MSSCYPSGRLWSTVLDKLDRTEVCRRQSLRWAPSAVKKYTAEATLGMPTLCFSHPWQGGKQVEHTHPREHTHSETNTLLTSQVSTQVIRRTLHCTTS